MHLSGSSKSRLPDGRLTGGAICLIAMSFPEGSRGGVGPATDHGPYIAHVVLVEGGGERQWSVFRCWDQGTPLETVWLADLPDLPTGHWKLSAVHHFHSF